MALAIFDLDNTLIAGDSDHAWGEYLVEKNIVDAAVYKQANDKFYHDYQSGNLDIQEYLSFALAPLAEHPLSQLEAWREDFLMTRIKPMMLSQAAELIAFHQEKGHTLLIITATNRFVTERIADMLGIPNLIATEPEFLDGKFTGRVAGVPSFQEGKVVRLHTWLETNPHDLASAYFYSDSHNDLPLMEQIGNPIAIDADERLITHARARGWPVRSLRA